jgi:formyltetrahydrofolate deformylase
MLEPTTPSFGRDEDGFVLSLSCSDRPGIVYAVAKFLVAHSCTIVESHQFGDQVSGLFFMRIGFLPVPSAPGSTTHVADPPTLDSLRVAFAPVATKFSMTWHLDRSSARQRVLIMVSKLGHCLNDLMFRASTGWLSIDVVAVVSNHGDLGAMARSYGVPFHHIPVTSETKPEAEARLMSLVDELDVDLVVLARYMQILSDGACARLWARAINIHHSMLPSFKGARPYERAHERGVKVIGATAHYVTSDLDEGPIIEQATARIDHAMSPSDVAALGRDTECLALARAVRWHAQRRVFLDRGRTVVFQ